VVGNELSRGHNSYVNGTPFSATIKTIVMIVPLVAVIAIVVGVILFLVFAGKKKSKGKDLGETGRT
jgi:hypothetical protein